MARYTGPSVKQSRRIGIDLGSKTNAVKVARRLTVPPGFHGRKGTKKISDFGIQMKEKLILIINHKEDLGEEEDSDTIDAQPDKNTLKSFEAHWAGIEFGPTMLLNSAMKSSFPGDKNTARGATIERSTKGGIYRPFPAI